MGSLLTKGLPGFLFQNVLTIAHMGQIEGTSGRFGGRDPANEDESLGELCLRGLHLCTSCGASLL